MHLPCQMQFKELILDGTKIHTIRKWKRLPKVEDKIKMATGNRTKQYNMFCDSYTLKGIQEIRIHKNDILVDGILLDFDTIRELAINDGFAGGMALLNWFESVHKTNKVLFDGHIFHWTDKRY